MDCTPSALAEAASCYCYDKETREKVKIYLLAVIAGLDGLAAEELARLAACYCYDEKTARAITVMLACDAVNAI